MINREEIEDIIRKGILGKYLATPYPIDSLNTICNARVKIEEEEIIWDGGGFYVDKIIIEVQTETPKFQRKKWVRVWL